MAILGELRVRFSLQALLLAVAIGIFVVASLVGPVRREQRAVASMHDFARFRRNYSGRFVHAGNSPILADIRYFVARWFGEDFVCPIDGVFLDTDCPGDPSALDDIPTIEDVAIGGDVAKTSLIPAILRRVPHARIVAVVQADGMTADDFQSVASLPELSSLQLQFSSDASCERLLGHLSRLDRIARIQVHCGRLSPTAIEHLTEFKALKAFGVQVDDGSESSLQKELEAALPGCAVFAGEYAYFHFGQLFVSFGSSDRTGSRIVGNP
jgi:hypothetical protein